MKKHCLKISLAFLFLFIGCSPLKDQTEKLLHKEEISDKQTAKDLLSELQQKNHSDSSLLHTSFTDSLHRPSLLPSQQNIDSTVPQLPKEFLAIQALERELRNIEYSLTDKESDLSKEERKVLKKQQKDTKKVLAETRKAFQQKQQEKKKEMERQRKIEEGDTLSFWEKQFPKKTERHLTYPRVYKEKPRSILISYPWNRSNCSFGRELFYASLQKTLALRGYYIVPPLLMIDFFKDTLNHTRHSKDQDLRSYKKNFNADAVLFVTIYRIEHEWWSSATKMNAEYLLRSTTTNDTLFFRKVDYTYDTPLPPRRFKKDKNALEISEEEQVLLNVCISMQEAALSDFPFGPYHTKHAKDSMFFSHRPFMRYNINTRPE